MIDFMHFFVRFEGKQEFYQRVGVGTVVGWWKPKKVRCWKLGERDAFLDHAMLSLLLVADILSFDVFSDLNANLLTIQSVLFVFFWPPVSFVRGR